MFEDFVVRVTNLLRNEGEKGGVYVCSACYRDQLYLYGEL